MDFIGLIAAHGNGIVLLVAFVDQFGVPVPAIAVLLAAGAVAGQERIGLTGVLAAAWLGTVAGDTVLFYAGRWHGGRVIRRLCSLSIAPDRCIRKTELSFQRLGWKALVIAKFVPGLALFAAPVAGALRVPALPFLVFDSLGSLLYNLVVIGLGFLLHDRVDSVAGWFRALGGAAVPVVVCAILAYCAWRIVQKQDLMRPAADGRQPTEQSTGSAPRFLNARTTHL